MQTYINSSVFDKKIISFIIMQKSNLYQLSLPSEVVSQILTYVILDTTIDVRLDFLASALVCNSWYREAYRLHLYIIKCPTIGISSFTDENIDRLCIILPILDFDKLYTKRDYEQNL
jgi:F-box-like